MVGLFLLHGVGVAPNASQAVEWLERAAKAGNSEAKLTLAHVLDEGARGEAGRADAITHYRDLAYQENPQALFHLASKLAHGQGCEKDEKKALNLYTRAAELGSHAAAFALAMIYGQGALGVQVDREKSRYYFELRESLYNAQRGKNKED